ncbi:alpha/beta-hydrolase [Exidia glandulosa HHB12029]|uniref:Alpha/beta-hydrolase n=1 Tax=Exidia glandulosa HHB12029 TaxID=1314781 RepID=A0A165DJS5_EXIGL|nr:alpha/beta-hydrolase [Exidia glandulosa HHB12029]
MVFAFRSQPFKTIYLVYFAFTTLLLHLPLWIVASIFPGSRSRRSFSFARAVLVHGLRAFAAVEYNIGFTPPPDPNDQSAKADALGFVWIEPVGEDFIVDEIADARRANRTRLARISGYWLGQRDAKGRFGQPAAPGERVLYSLHGTIFLIGGFLARAVNLEYRLSSAAPYAAANPFPTALLDALAGYRYLVHGLGFSPKNIIIEGDSAGAHLGMTLIMYLIKSHFQDLPPPGGLLMLSPTLDWGNTHDLDPLSSMKVNHFCDYIYRVFANGYTGRALLGLLPQSELATNAYLSPASLKLPHVPGRFGGFPPTCIIAGNAEVALDQMRIARHRISQDNDEGTVTYHEYPDAIHDWLTMSYFEPQGSAALADIQQWIVSLWRERDEERTG